MSYGPVPLQGDSESLQTDVMRFMAIIGFCLIAILALVKEATPTDRTPAPALVPERMETTGMAAVVAPASPAPIAEPVMDTYRTPEPATTSEPKTQLLATIPSSPAIPPRWEQPLPSLIPDPVIPRPTPKPRTRAREQPKPPAKQETAPVSAPVSESDAGLSLRFASDNDFLRLIAKGEIEVYAYHGARQRNGTLSARAVSDRKDSAGTGTSGTEILKLDGSYQFRDSPAPGRVYELLPQTIPGLVVNALRTTGRDIDAFTWAIVLPARIEAQLERHLGRVSSGELVIDRYGEVQHVAPG